MRSKEQPSWTLEELGARVAQALAVDYPGPSNGQVRAIPDARTIRYYASLGLLDRPGANRGRTLLYGQRHLLQLVAIKRLQAAGDSLADVQERLLGASDPVLEALAKLPAGVAVEASERATPKASRRSESFWRERPSAEATAPSATDGFAAAPSTPLLTTLVPLEGAALLLLPGRFSDEELGRIQAAARPLIDELRARAAGRGKPGRTTR